MRECHFGSEETIYKPVENEDVFFVDTKGNGNVMSLAVLVDGADGRKKRILPDGQEIALPDFVSGEKTPARIWADLLQQEIAQIAMDHNKELPEVVYEATKNATKEFPAVAGVNLPEKLDPLQIPAASVLVSRINNGIFEAFSNGDCGMVIRYQDGTVETYTGNEVLKNIRAKREETIMQNHPHFEEKSPEEQAKIRYLYMQKTKEALGKEYYTPFLGGADKMKDFSRITRILRDKRKDLSTHGNGMMWSLATRVEMVESVALFSVGIEPAFMNEEIAKEFITHTDKKQAMKMLEILSALGAVLKANQHAVAVQSVNNGKLQKVAFTDRTALLFNLVDERQL